MSEMWSSASEGGVAGRPPVLLVHSLAMSAAADWAELAPRLEAGGRRVLSVDLPGHGHSLPIETGDGRPSRLADALARLVDAEGGPVDVVGYSVGARLAYELPTRSAAVRRLVLGGLAPFEPFAGLDLGLVRAVLGGAEPPDPMLGVIAQMLSLPGNDPESLFTFIGGLQDEPFAPSERFDVPTLIVIGDQDEMSAGSATLADQLPHARVARVPGDHVGALHGPAFGDVVCAFLDAP